MYFLFTKWYIRKFTPGFGIGLNKIILFPFPLNIFNDYIIVESSFYDNVIHDYTPSLYEIGLGIGGVALSLIIILIAIRNLDFLPSVIQIRKPLVDEKSD